MGKGEMKMQPTHSVIDSRNPIALGSANARAIFISHTYAHLMGAIVAFTLLKVLLFSTGLTQSIARALAGVNWVLVVAVAAMTPVGCTTTALAQKEFDPSWNAAPFAALRLAYSQRSDFDPAWELDPRRKALVTAANAGDSETVIDLSEEWLEICPVDAEAHLIVSAALDSVGRKREALRHGYAFHGLVLSILDSGTGESRDSAMKVISVHEEYYVMRALGAEPRGQSFVDGHDRIAVRLNGREQNLYFDVSIPFAADSKLFREIFPPGHPLH